MTKTDKYFAFENCRLRRSFDKIKLVTNDPARNTMCKVSGIENEKDQLLITETPFFIGRSTVLYKIWPPK